MNWQLPVRLPSHLVILGDGLNCEQVGIAQEQVPTGSCKKAWTKYDLPRNKGIAKGRITVKGLQSSVWFIDGYLRGKTKYSAASVPGRVNA